MAAHLLGAPMLPREPPGRSPSALLCGQKLVRAQNDWPVYFEEAPKLFEFGFRESIELEALAPRHYSFSDWRIKPDLRVSRAASKRRTIATQVEWLRIGLYRGVAGPQRVFSFMRFLYRGLPSLLVFLWLSTHVSSPDKMKLEKSLWLTDPWLTWTKVRRVAEGLLWYSALWLQP